MKEVKFKNGKTITTPWLRPDEAAAYCGVSRAFFDKHGRDLPHGGNDRTRLYKVQLLDSWVNNELDIPFAPPSEEKKKPQRRIKRHYTEVDEPLVAINRHNGKAFVL